MAFYVAIIHLLDTWIISFFQVSFADCIDNESDVTDDNAYDDSNDDNDDNEAHDDGEYWSSCESFSHLM